MNRQEGAAGGDPAVPQLGHAGRVPEEGGDERLHELAERGGRHRAAAGDGGVKGAHAHYLENRIRNRSLGVDFCFHFIKKNAIRINDFSGSYDGS